LYDDFPGLHFVYTGSSMLRLDRMEGDLSRRQIVYDLPGLSFREYLLFACGVDIPPMPFPRLLEEHPSIAEGICARIRVLPAFEAYLRSGYYPFFKEVKRGFSQRLAQIAAQVLESDYPAIEDVTLSTIRKARKMLMILADRIPQKVNFEKLCRELETDRNQGLKMLDALRRGGLLGLLSDRARSLKTLSRPDKIYLGDPNLMHALSPDPDVGTLRETFFFNQVRQVLPVHYPARGDFLVDDRWLFEVGGRSKTFAQIADAPDSYLAVDDTEIGSRHRIPLWMFGLLY
ncbi:MAG: ATP-binding protein, partial [Kiritimatiellae bacterium]|nr:ATP-binding protein [Kiritimatiellia bacterium]